ncbi:hypothetical protein [Cryptosporangium minutisporangium]|uniref:Uncharacterized protein n=1 Tax=Cryptosporangium minutisporangium TaxID=113569 RepID=A0ABP6SY44_9ACTN
MAELSDGDEALREEVEELTELLREDSDFGDLRTLLRAHGMHESDVILAGLIGGEDNRQDGVFIDADLRCIRFEIDSAGRGARWEETDVESLAQYFGAVAIGLAMRRAGDLA